MKVVIKENGHRKVIKLPNFLIATLLGKNWLKKNFDLNLNRSQLKQIGKALSQFKKQCNLPIVERISEDFEVIVRW